MREYIGGIPNNPNKDYRENLSKKIADELADKAYGNRSKVGQEGVFTRDRILTISRLVITIIKFKTSVQRELDSFFKEISNEDFNIRAVTKGAFTKARAKLDPWAFKRLNQVAADAFYEKASFYTWHQKRLLAVDGTTLMLPNHPTVTEEFGQHEFGPKADSKRSMALASVLYDVLNLLALDSEIAPYDSSEKNLLVKHLDKAKEGDLLLLDRGYPSLWLFFLLYAKKIDFCVRMKESWWHEARKFSESGETERLVTFKLPKKDWGKLDGYKEIRETEITCRLVKVKLEGRKPGEEKTEILCTSLLDGEQHKCEDFKELYHYRWNQEEAYKLLKSRVETERFSGKTALAVKQDFHAKIFLLTLTAAYAHPVEQKVREEFKADENRKYGQKINRTSAISMTQHILIAVMLKRVAKKALESFDLIVSKTREIIRPERSSPRKKRPRRHYNMNYKPL